MLLVWMTGSVSTLHTSLSRALSSGSKSLFGGPAELVRHSGGKIVLIEKKIKYRLETRRLKC